MIIAAERTAKPEPSTEEKAEAKTPSSFYINFGGSLGLFTTQQQLEPQLTSMPDIGEDYRRLCNELENCLSTKALSSHDYQGGAFILMCLQGEREFDSLSGTRGGDNIDSYIDAVLNPRNELLDVLNRYELGKEILQELTEFRKLPDAKRSGATLLKALLTTCPDKDDLDLLRRSRAIAAKPR